MTKVHGWLHIACMYGGDLIAAELHGRLLQSGLYDATSTIHVSLLGDEYKRSRLIDNIFSRFSKYDVHYNDNNLKKYEWAALNHMHKTAQSQDNFNLWYIHTKGASNCRPDVPSNIQSNLRLWRNLMCYYVIGNHKQCNELLLDYDTCGALFNKDHYAGNFWWSTSNHVKQISEPTDLEMSERMNAEFWIGKKGNHYNLYKMPCNDLYGFNGEIHHYPIT